MSKRKVRHILGLSGGKDSTALALYMKDRVPEIEYFFCDTGKELPETYEFISRLEVLLGKKIVILRDEEGFDYWLEVYGGFLPSPNARWCTKQLKIVPIEKFVGKDKAISYIGIRADEDRVGYISTKDNIKPVFPFMRDGLNKSDILQILEESGVGMPEYYKWRSRSGCFFCFFQRKIEWVRLSEVHPDLFAEAVRYEQEHEDGRQFFWNENEPLLDIITRKDEIVAGYEKVMKMKREAVPNQTLIQVLASIDDGDEDICAFCQL